MSTCCYRQKPKILFNVVSLGSPCVSIFPGILWESVRQSWWEGSSTSCQTWHFWTGCWTLSRWHLWSSLSSSCLSMAGYLHGAGIPERLYECSLSLSPSWASVATGWGSLNLSFQCQHLLSEPLLSISLFMCWQLKPSPANINCL